jgi:hypothetical protein
MGNAGAGKSFPCDGSPAIGDSPEWLLGFPLKRAANAWAQVGRVARNSVGAAVAEAPAPRDDMGVGWLTSFPEPRNVSRVYRTVLL